MFFENPFLSAFVQFAILGTMGEIVAKLLSKKEIVWKKIVGSIFVWGILGVIVKFIFAGFTGFVEHVTLKGYLPEGKIYSAFFKSFFTNAMFGPWLVIGHRFLDNLFLLRLSHNNIDDIEVLENMTKLEMLSLFDNNILDSFLI